MLGFWKHLNKFEAPFLQDIYSCFGLGVKRLSNFAVAWLSKSFIVFISKRYNCKFSVFLPRIN